SPLSGPSPSSPFPGAGSSASVTVNLASASWYGSSTLTTAPKSPGSSVGYVHVTEPSALTFFSPSGTGPSASGVMMEISAIVYGSKHLPVIVTVEPSSYDSASVEALAGTPLHAPGGVGAPAAGGASATAGAAAHVMASRSPAPRRTAAWPRR